MKLDVVNQIRRELEAAEEKLCSLRECVGAVSVPKLDGMPKAKTQSSPVERIAQKILEAETAIDNLRVKLAETAADLTDEIYRRVKKPRARHVLIRRYVLGQMFKEIFVDLGISDGDVFYWHRCGVKEFNSFKEEKEVA